MWGRLLRLLLCMVTLCSSLLSSIFVPSVAQAAYSQSTYGIPIGAKIDIDGYDKGQYILEVWNTLVDGRNEGTNLGLQKRSNTGDRLGGYPKVDANSLSTWVQIFGGNLNYVKSKIGQFKSHIIYNKKTIAGVELYSLADIAVLSGARGDDWVYGTNKFITSSPPKTSIKTKNGATTFKAGDSVTFIGYGESDVHYHRTITMTMKGATGKDLGLNYTQTKDYSADGKDGIAKMTSPDQTIKLMNQGTFTYNITVLDGVGRTATSSITITVGPGPNQVTPKPPTSSAPTTGPQAIFDLPTSAKVNTQVDILEHSKAGDSPISSWTWKVEPNAKRTGLLGGYGLSRITFTETGTFDITLTVKDGKGRTDSVTHTINVYSGSAPAPAPTPAPAPAEPMNLPPTARFTMPGNAKQGATVDVFDSSSDPDGTIVDWDWDISPSSGVKDDLGDTGGTITFDEEGDYTLKLTVTDDDGETDTYERDITVKNRPPVARISAPDEIVQGDDLIIKSNSYDPDGEIKSITWSSSPADGTMLDSQTGLPHVLQGEENKVYFNKPGTYKVTLVAEDDQGKKSEPDEHTITVKPAIPTAFIDLTPDSFPKQNRKVVFDSSASTSSQRYPIDFSKNNWEFIPPAGVSADKIKIVTSPDKKTRTVLFKEPGDYVARLKVTNAAGNTSEWYEFPIIIYPDLKPEASFYVSKAQIRDAANGRQATINLEDTTVSPDSDIITKRTWKYRYDSNNDGNFEDESWVLLSDNNNPTPSLVTSKVGKYQFELYVEESFGQPTIPEFIGPADKRTDDTSDVPLEEKVVEVINLEPYGDFVPRAKKKVDIVFTVGNVDNAKVADLATKITQNVEAKLGAAGVDYKITSMQTSSLSMQDTFAWQEYSHYNTDSAYGGSTSNGSRTTNHIVLNGKNITFYGYDSPNRKDWLFLPNNTPGRKTFDFAVDETQSSYHSLEGAGYLFNASISGSGDSAVLNGYAILSNSYQIQIVKIKNANVNQFHEGSLGDLGWNRAPFTTVGSFSKNGSQHQFHVEATPTQIDVWDNNVKIVDALQLDEQLGNGFGPMASYAGHGCSQLTQVTFKNIKMETVTGKSLDEVLKEPEWRDGSLRFVDTITDKQIAEFNDPIKSSFIYSRLLENDLDYSVLGTWQNQSQVQNVIQQNDNKGTFIDNSNMNTALSSYADYILKKVNEKQGVLQGYVLLGQEVQYDYYYDDVENDPQYAQKWMYNHDPNYFQNSLGLAGFHLQPQPSPIYKFDKVGEYDVKFQIRDNPLNDDRFDNYRLWSAEPDEAFKLFVHRKPIAQFNMNTWKINSLDYGASYSNVSYDLDHQYEGGQGIVASQWKWKEGTGSWQDGTPTTLYGGRVYSIYLRVKDKEGEWSDPMIKVVSLSGNLPPVATFAASPNPVEVGQLITPTDHSYDPNPGDYIAYRNWRLQRVSDGQWFDYGSSFPSRINQIGKFKIELKVQDSFGAVSTPYTQIIDVIPANRAPVARFTVTPNPVPEDVQQTYKDTSYDPDNDPIVSREWRYSKNGGAWVSGQPTDIGKLGVGVYRIQLRVKDQPAIAALTPLWSNWYEQVVTVSKGNEKPVANLVLSPNPNPADEPLAWTDKSTDPEGKNLQAYDLIITQNETGVSKQFTGVYAKGSGASMDMSSKFISIFETSSFPNEGVGTYTVKYRVKDTTPNGLSPALWSDYQVQNLTIEEPLKIKAEVSPPTQKSGAAITLTSETLGRAEKVIARADWNRDGDFDDLNETIQLTNSKPISDKANDWSKSVIIPLPTKDGDYAISFTAYKGAKSIETVKSVKVVGNVYDNFVIEMINR
ncbi:PKD domain-containing protein [Aneurinibacillus tyrosinisolvens]|uniref:PKD domain-containing protein n=1 Tax=Aneurinibacillus tyrosinisolvens TaxID=1443435 RepID=UPI00128B7F2D|nr:PKD domain-containing protein [Aneurinibacillus tyrosinisolvens]